MTERPEDTSGDRRRTGPLAGDDEETRVETPTSNDESTRRMPSQQPAGRTDASDSPEEGSGERRSSRNLRRAKPAKADSSDDAETRIAPAPAAASQGTRQGVNSGDTQENAYARGYFEAAEEREERLRDIYGGVDWLASFLGFIFVAVAGAIFAGIASLVLVPLGFSLDIVGVEGVAGITTLVILGILVFFSYLFGGYVAGRLSRFDGGRNGAMTVVWGTVVGALVLAVFGILPGALFQTVRDFLAENVTPVIVGLLDAGLIGLAIVVGAIIVAVLGGIAGGRLGSRFHTEIDRTT